jgi:hypothetical protein
VLLRLKREAEDEIHDEPPPEPSDLIASEDVFPEGGLEADEEDSGDEAAGFLPPLPGPLIAAATFVPTFLAVFFGVSYLLGGGTQTGPRASAPVPSAAALMSDLGAQGSPPLSEALRDPFVAPRLLDSPTARPGDPREATRPSDPREALRGSSAEGTTPPAIESTGPTLPPRVATSPVPEPRAARPAEMPRQPQAAVLTTTSEPPAPARKSGRDWAPAAAFTDREAASRLASSIQQQGYPVEIRQEQSSTRPWVVWIGAQPRGGERRP